MSDNPYKHQPDKAFWSRVVSNKFLPSELVQKNKLVLSPDDKLCSAGSCFASNLIPYIESAGLTYIRTEKLPRYFEELGQNLGYANFSANYGNVYTARQLLQLYLRALGEFKPEEDRWHENNVVIDPFRPGLKYPAKSDQEFDLITSSHLLATKKAFESADVFVFTLGLTEAWVSKQDGSTYPACPGTIAGTFDDSKYQFHNFNVTEIVDDLSIFIEKLRMKNPNVRIILSVSPVPLVATATNNHVLNATIYSKSVLRVAAEIISNKFENVSYFPAYEIITGPQAPENYFEADKRNVSQIGIETVMNALLEISGLKAKKVNFLEKIKKRQISPDLADISKRITEAECDEVMLDQSL